MKRPIRNIIALLIVVFPIYLVAILEKILDKTDLSIDGLFGGSMLYTFLGLLVIYFTNKYLLKSSLKVFISQKGSVLLDISISFSLLIVMFFVFKLGEVTYNHWFIVDIDKIGISNTLSEIFSNNEYIIFLLIPFIWLTEIFIVLSQAFILNNLWELNSTKLWSWVSIISMALLGAFVHIDNGTPGVISWFLILTASSFIYFKYRRVYPLIFASILYQTIDLISYWVYVL
jgi:hypothetical protein